ncbi:hypothetical protein [Nitrosophilus kaiyonis]|uniref:hypothetical protein n=1 Tax=Nitrosophilus kaiyonis TaxID=2930200 RepID=UPI002492DDEC|nr:hypothetical protein [Nitrosophilus kaiyonis]
MQDNDILIVEAEILPNGVGGWVIKAVNKETNEERFCNTIEEYSAFLNESVYTTQKDNFQAIWLESPKATPEMIADVREKLMKFYNEMENRGE